jgi:uncharacterized circularly permuted ATP-grasp superfamily protein
LARTPASQRKKQTDKHSLFAYSALPGIADEMLDTNGNIRPVWQHMVSALSRMPERELHDRFARTDRYLRDAGVFYRDYGSGANIERSWPISHIPVLIDGKEWESVSRGLIQRANLLEAVVADIYGENRLVQEGYIPPALIASNPEFLRPLVGTKPEGGHYLHFCSFEIGRGPDGNWWVIAHRLHQEPVLHWKTAWQQPAPSPISMQKPMSIGWPRFSVLSATRYRHTANTRKNELRF